MGTREIIQGADYSGLQIQYYHTPISGASLSAFTGDERWVDAKRNFANGGAEMSQKGVTPASVANGVMRQYQAIQSNANFATLDTGILEQNTMTLIAVGNRLSLNEWGIPMSSERSWDGGATNPYIEGAFMTFQAGQNYIQVQAGVRRPTGIGGAGGADVLSAGLSDTTEAIDKPCMFAGIFGVNGAGNRTVRVALRKASGWTFSAVTAFTPPSDPSWPTGKVENQISPIGISRNLNIGGYADRVVPLTASFRSNLGYNSAYMGLELGEDGLEKIYTSVKKRFTSYGISIL